MKNENILISGANGYIGSHVVDAVLKLFPHYTVTALDFKSDRIDKRAKFISVNILAEARNPDLYSMLGKPDNIIHLAWQDGFNHKADSHLDNLAAHYHFLQNMIDHGVKSVAVMGSMHEIGYYEGCVNENTPCNPLSLYGIAKNALRQALSIYTEDKHVGFKWLRAYYITGDDANNKSVFAKICEFSHDGKTTFPFTSGTNKYDFTDVNMLAVYIAKSALQDKINGIINVCSGQPVSLKDKVEEFIAEHQFNIRPEYGVYPSRKYDSPAIWGNADKINQIMRGGL